MEISANHYIPGDPRLIEQIVYELKSQGIFDQFRKECIADVDTKPAYQNLKQRVEGNVSSFLKHKKWSSDMNKNQVREQLRKNIYESGYLETGVERTVDQVVNPKINTIFLPKVEDLVYRFLGLDKPLRSDIKKELKINITDLLPTDLEAVSPESDHMNLKDDDLNISFKDNKQDDEESPSFELLDNQRGVVQHGENSVDSNLSGFSGLQSHDSNPPFGDNKECQMEISNQDSQASQNSSESHFHLSIVTSEENTKMEISEDSQSNLIKHGNNEPITEAVAYDASQAAGLEKDVFKKVANSNQNNFENKKGGVTEENSTRKGLNKTETEDKKDKKKIEEKRPEKKSEDKNSTDKNLYEAETRDKKSEKKNEDKKHERKTEDTKYKSSDKYAFKDKKDDKYRKSSSSSSRDKDRPSSQHSSKDRNKDRRDKSSASSKEKIEKDKMDLEKERSDRERTDRDKLKNSSGSGVRHGSSKESKSSSSSKKESSQFSSFSKDTSSKNKDKSRCSHGESKSKSSSLDKYKKDKSSHNGRHSSSSNSLKRVKEKDKRRDSKKESKDDHYSSKDNKTDRRSTDRDSNDGQSNKQSQTNSFSESSSSQSQKNSQQSEKSKSSNGSEDSGNSDALEQAPAIGSNLEAVETQKFKCIKPKFASNFKEARKIMKIRKQLAKMERQNQLSLINVTKPVVAECEQVINGVAEEAKTEEKKEEKELEKESVEPPKENNKMSLQSTELSKENWEALEARLAQEMSNVNYNAYESEYDDYDNSSYSEVLASPKKKANNVDKSNSTNEQSLSNNIQPKDNKGEESERNCRYLDEPNQNLKEKLQHISGYISKLEQEVELSIKTSQNNFLTASSKTGIKRKLEENENVDLKNNNKALYVETITETKKKRRAVVAPNINAAISKARKEKVCNSTEITTGDNFLLPLSPADSDNSYEREKKEEYSPKILKVKRTTARNNIRNQRYSSDDLYKPRPTFTTRRSRGAKTDES